MEHLLVFNIKSFTTDIYLPEAYIVENKKYGCIVQKAIKGTIKSYDIAFSENELALIGVAEDLDPPLIAKKFNNSKKNYTLVELINRDDKTKKIVQEFCHQKLAAWLHEITSIKGKICFGLKRESPVKDHLLTYQDKIIPNLFFKLKEDGIDYTLNLTCNSKKINLLDEQIKILCNEPAWIVLNKTLLFVDHIKATMLKPFLNKEHIFIPEKTVKTYFQKFIVKAASKVDIKAEGFEMIHENQLQTLKIEIIRDIFSGQYVIHPIFKYANGIEFSLNDQRDQKISLNIEGEQIELIKVSRDKEEEQNRLEELIKFDLEKTSSKLLKPLNYDYEYSVHQWLIQNQSILKKLSIDIAIPIINQKQVSLSTNKVEVKVDKMKDWFDVHAVVKVKGFNIPFAQFVPYIRDQNHLFELPDNTIFVIPNEWMSSYVQLVRFAKINQNRITLNHNQYVVLESVGWLREGKSKEDKSLDKFLEIISAKLKAKLRPYQVEGIKWMLELYHRNLGGCLADDMGLGKTIQTLATLVYAKEQKANQEQVIEELNQLSLFDQPVRGDNKQPLQALIVLPASLVYNWRKEIQKFVPTFKVYSHVGSKRTKALNDLKKYDIVLTTYQTCLRDKELIGEIYWEYIVLDESQQIKNKDGKIFKAINGLNSNHKLALSGTPIENSLADLWSQMQFINPDLLGGFRFFKNEFIIPIEKAKNEEKKEQLYQLVTPYLLRRTKQQVAKDLPSLITKTFVSDMLPEQEKLYESEKSMIRNYLLNTFNSNNGKNKVHVLQSLMKLRQLANHTSLTEEDIAIGGKFDDVIEHWKTVVKAGHKVLIFSSFVKHLNLFEAYFKEQKEHYSIINGSLNPEKRKNEIEKFENNDIVKTFLISIKSGGTGLNLTQADYVFILDPWWNPFIEKQAIARAHRIGQTKQVVAIKFITRNTIEEKIVQLQEKKTLLAEEIIRDEENSILNPKVLEELLN